MFHIIWINHMVTCYADHIHVLWCDLGWEYHFRYTLGQEHTYSYLVFSNNTDNWITELGQFEIQLRVERIRTIKNHKDWLNFIKLVPFCRLDILNVNFWSKLDFLIFVQIFRQNKKETKKISWINSRICRWVLLKTINVRQKSIIKWDMIDSLLATEFASEVNR